MGAITNKCFELIESAGNYEERRSTGILINIGYFNALDCEAGEVTKRSRQDQKADCPTPEARFRTAINDIP